METAAEEAARSQLYQFVAIHQVWLPWVAGRERLGDGIALALKCTAGRGRRVQSDDNRRGWTRLDEGGRGWARVDEGGEGGRGWTRLDEAGRGWTRLDEGRQVWTRVGGIGLTCQ